MGTRGRKECAGSQRLLLVDGRYTRPEDHPPEVTCPECGTSRPVRTHYGSAIIGRHMAPT